MILGTHNSVTYMRPRQWWLRPFAWMARCQRLSLEEQWNAGVRCFDFRVNKDIMYMCHGLAEYDFNVYDMCEFIEEHKPSYVRFCYDGDNPNHAFFTFCSFIEQNYPDTMFQFCSRKNGWTIHEDNFDKEYCEVQDSPDTLKEVVLGPEKLLRRQWNRIKLTNDDCIVSMDFIDKYKNGH